MKAARLLSIVLIANILGLGLLYYRPTVYPVLIIGGLVVFGIAVFVIGFVSMRAAPRLAVRIIHLGGLTALPVIALTVAGTTWLGLNVMDWLAKLGNADLVADSEAVKGVLTGALGTFIGGLWLEAAEKGEGPLWPGHWVRKGFEAAYTDEAIRYVNSGEKNTRFQSAVFLDDAGEGVSGWSLSAALARLDMMDEIRRMP